MSSDVKGSRKPKKSPEKKNQPPSKFKITSELIIVLLIAGLYALFTVETLLDKSVIAVMLSAFLFVAFLVFLVIVRSGKHKLKREFGSLLYVFLGLSALSLVWEALFFVKIVDAATLSQAALITVTGVVNAVVAVVIVAAVAVLEKSSPKDLYLAPGDTKVIPFAVIAFLLCLVLGIGATYYLFGGAALGQDKLVPLVAAILLFSILGGCSEELLFRGLLMSRITPILGETYGNIYQALVFGVFEAVTFYLITREISLMPAMFLIGAMTGFYWGRATLRSKSLISPALLHAGFYMLVALPLIVGL